jgi:WD40 repeat protein
MTAYPPCLEWREKLALGREDLSPADQQALDAHVSTCSACSAALADYHFFEARLDALPPPSIKPLPRLSPHFFEETERDLERSTAQAASKNSGAEPVQPRENRTRSRKAVFFWRSLSAAVVVALILASSLLFRQLSLSNQAARPAKGEMQCDLNQHTSAVTAVAWSPNGQYVATASRDHTVKVWNAQSCKLLNTYWGHTGAVDALAWAHDSQRIASASDDGTVQIWNALNSTAILTYSQHHLPVLAVAWSPDDREIASGGDDDTLRVWNVRTGATSWKYIDEEVAQTEPFDTISWSPDGSKIAAGSWNFQVQIFDAKNGDNGPLYSYANHIDSVNAVAWSPNGQYIASASSDSTVQVWKTDPQDLGQVVQTYAQHRAANAVAWSPDGQYIASGYADGTVRIWNAFTGATIKVYSESTSAINSVDWRPAPPGTKSDELISASDDDTASVWKISGL